MTITLHNLRPNPGATKKRKRVGRGPGSGRGKTSVRGQKGQKSRSGSHGSRVGFEGGQMPIQRRLPKRGFKNPFRKEWYPVNLGLLEARFEAGDVSIEDMQKAGLVPRSAKLVKVLGHGELTKKLSVSAHGFSKTAAEKLAAAGGSADIVAPAKKTKQDEQSAQ
jgi:large subunit ribosomal protein L15